MMLLGLLTGLITIFKNGHAVVFKSDFVFISVGFDRIGGKDSRCGCEDRSQCYARSSTMRTSACGLK